MNTSWKTPLLLYSPPIHKINAPVFDEFEVSLEKMRHGYPKEKERRAKKHDKKNKNRKGVAISKEKERE